MNYPKINVNFQYDIGGSVIDFTYHNIEQDAAERLFQLINFESIYGLTWKEGALRAQTLINLIIDENIQKEFIIFNGDVWVINPKYLVVEDILE